MKIYEFLNSAVFLNFKTSIVIIIAYENRYVTHPLDTNDLYRYYNATSLS